MIKKLALTREEAAALCGLTVGGFDVWVRKGIVPGTIKGTRRFSRAALERALSGEVVKDDDDDPDVVFARWEREQQLKR